MIEGLIGRAGIALHEHQSCMRACTRITPKGKNKAFDEGD